VRVSINGHLGKVSALTLVAAERSRAVAVEDGRVLAEAGVGARWELSQGAGSAREIRCTLSSGDREQSLEAPMLRIESRDGGMLRVLSGRVERVYPGVIEIRPGKNGWTVINEAPLEIYLQGVVAAEVSPRWHPEALKALAVAARSYSERNHGRHGPVYDLCDTTHCHCYAGVGKIGESIRDAVIATSGIVALYDGRPIDAVYCADCGGRTQTVHDAWGSHREIGYLKSIIDAPPQGGPDYCSINPKHTWSVTFSPAELERLLNRSPETRVGTLRRVEVIGTTDSGRPSLVEVRGGGGVLPELDRPPCELAEEAALPAHRAAAASSSGPAAVVRRLPLDQFSRVLGEALGEHRGGSMLDLRPRDDGGLVVEGKGSGHGVGLCQYGAQGLAARYGKTWEEILRHYYRDIELGPAP
jgi:stage II sporulation protein D (peptidoglycan lytic transglycosylase)